MLDHISIPVTDLERAATFYDAALEGPGLMRCKQMAHAVGYGAKGSVAPCFWLLQRKDSGAARPGMGLHVSFSAATRAAVNLFHARALAAGGIDAGKPGIRPKYTQRFTARSCAISMASRSKRSADAMNKRVDPGERLAAIPSVEKLLQQDKLRATSSLHGHPVVVDAVRAVLVERRAAIKAGTAASTSPDELVGLVLDRIAAASQPSLRRIFNLTGTILHTNLGRALLPEATAEAAKQVLVAPSNLEFDPAGGERGERDSHLESLVCRLTGAEAATVVNNNAAGVLLALSAVAFGKVVPVSRGELIEIGGAFRIPGVIESAGCRIREIGTTNRTHLRDYERAIGPDTAAVLKVHTSNYAIVGFTASVSEADLAALAHAKDIVFITDLGSGSLIDMTALGLPAERTPAESLRDGADLVCFSGDKLLGGAQAGFVVGRRHLVDRLRRNPLKRALRLDKARIAALETVLRLYLDPERARSSIPTLRLLTRPVADIEAAAQRLLPIVQAWCGPLAVADVAGCASQVGSGSLPVDRLPSAAVRIWWVEARGVGTGLARISRALRALPVPVIGRIQEDAFWLDFRCLEGAEDEALVADQLRKSTL